MENISRHYKSIRVSFWKTSLLVILAAWFFAPVIPKFERGQDNCFHISVNGTYAGTAESAEEAEEIVGEVRRDIAREQGEMVFIPAEVESKGEELLIGTVDERENLKNSIRSIMEDSQLETLQHAYTVKINQYTVNLSSSDEILTLLRSALAKYDTKEEYDVELIIDPDRELNVLTTSVFKKKEALEKEASLEGAGVEAYLEELEELNETPDTLSFEELDYGLVDLDFGDTIEIVDAYLMEQEINSLEKAIEEVTKEQETQQIYEVQSGDTLSQIAEEQGISIEELIAINPTLETERSIIRTGDELIITIPEPELSVVYSERVYVEDSYDAETVYIENDEWYTTETVVRREPSAGFRKAAAVVTYRNSRALSEEIVKEEVLYEPVAKIVERGTKIPPTYLKPISGGRVSSYFGRRNAPTRGASTYHKGVDWATPVGTAVVASSGGTVTRAGWGSGYGYVVYINHGDGRETRYGHLSKVLVSVGQTVKQGQKIALSGNTGRSTGPHLHFEILINGRAVDPLKHFN